MESMSARRTRIGAEDPSRLLPPWVTEVLAERLPSLRLVDAQRLDYFPNITFRGPTRLHVTWSQ